MTPALGIALRLGGRRLVPVAAGLLALVLLVVVFAFASLTPFLDGPASAAPMISAVRRGAIPAAQLVALRAAAARAGDDSVPGSSVQGADASGTSGVLRFAAAQLGKPYVWGGASPATSFDCSGLVQWSYGQVGVRLPRTAQAQYDATERVSPGDLRPGDLVFFAQTYPSGDWITHVGIYWRDGLMINAANPDQGILVLPLSDPFWAGHYAGAGRVRA